MAIWTDTAVSNIYNYVSSMSGFDQYFLDMVDQGWLQNYLHQYPVSYYITHNSAVGPNIYNNVGDYMDLLMQHMDYVTNNSGQNVLADAMNNMYTQEPPMAHQLFMAIQQAVDPQMQRFAIGHLGAQEQLAVKTLVDLGEDLGMVSTLDSVGKSDLLWQHLNQDPVGLAESYIHAVSSVGTAAAMAFYQGLTLDQDVLTFPQLTANGQPLQQVYNQALAQYANNNLSGAFFDYLGSNGYDYLFNTNTLSLLGGIVLANNGDSMVASYVSEQGWNGFNSILAQLELSPMPYYIGCNGDAGDMANIMSQFINSYTISLAEHDIYGSSRLGTKNYKPGQIYASWNFAQGTYDTLSLMSKRPWYSGTYNSLIDSNVQGSNIISLLSSHTGLRQYELSNHLGNVQSTISDEPYLKGTNGTAVAQRSPALAAAYDYYPFGMLMPDRYISDTASHCVLVNKPQWITTYQTVCYDSLVKHRTWLWAQVELIGSATSTFLGDGSLQVTLTSPKTDGIKINVNAPIGQAAEVTIPAQSFKGDFIAAVVETVNGVDKVVKQIALTNGASLSINFTPSASSTNSIWIGANTNIAIGSLYTYTIETICITQKVSTQQNALVNVCDDAGDKYRYGFNGKEKLNEWSGIGNAIDFGARVYDSRIGRWLSVDPMAFKYSFASPYSFTMNNPVLFIDPDGRELRLNGAGATEKGMFESILEVAFDNIIMVSVAENGTVSMSGDKSKLNTSQLNLYNALNNIIIDQQITRLFVVDKSQRNHIGIGMFRATNPKSGENVKRSNAVDLYDMKFLNGMDALKDYILLAHEIEETYLDQKTDQAGDYETESKVPHEQATKLQNEIDGNGNVWEESLGDDKIKSGSGYIYHNYTTKKGEKRVIEIHIQNNDPVGIDVFNGRVVRDGNTFHYEPEESTPTKNEKSK